MYIQRSVILAHYLLFTFFRRFVFECEYMCVYNILLQKSPTYPQKSPKYPQKSPKYLQKSPKYPQKSPEYPQKSPIFSHKSPIYPQPIPIFPKKNWKYFSISVQN